MLGTVFDYTVFSKISVQFDRLPQGVPMPHPMRVPTPKTTYQQATRTIGVLLALVSSVGFAEEPFEYLGLQRFPWASGV
jgi:hypothetical protein